MRAPGEPADGVLVARHDGQRTAGGIAHVKSADGAVDARGRDHGLVVLVPVVRQNLGGHGAGEGLAVAEAREAGAGHRVGGGRGVHGHDGDEVVFGGHGGAEVVDAQVRVARHGRDDGRVGRAELGAVGAAADGQSLEGLVAGGRPELDGAVPRGRDEGVLGDGVPGHREGLALVLVEVHDGELVDLQVEQLDAAVAGRDGHLVLVDLGPGQVVERVVRVVGLFQQDALGREPEAEETAIAHDAVVGRRGDGQAAVVVGRVLDGVGVESGRAEF